MTVIVRAQLPVHPVPQIKPGCMSVCEGRRDNYSIIGNVRSSRVGHVPNQGRRALLWGPSGRYLGLGQCMTVKEGRVVLLCNVRRRKSPSPINQTEPRFRLLILSFSSLSRTRALSLTKSPLLLAFSIYCLRPFILFSFLPWLM